MAEHQQPTDWPARAGTREFWLAIATSRRWPAPLVPRATVRCGTRCVPWYRTGTVLVRVAGADGGRTVLVLVAARGGSAGPWYCTRTRAVRYRIVLVRVRVQGFGLYSYGRKDYTVWVMGLGLGILILVELHHAQLHGFVLVHQEQRSRPQRTTSTSSVEAGFELSTSR